VKVLITGANGYLGNVLKNRIDFNEIYSLGRNGSNFNYNIQEHIPALPFFDCVIHAAGKAHLVPRSEEDKQAFWDVNVIGTGNLLKALEEHPPHRFVFISTVAVYGKSAGILLNEQTPLLAKDPYGQSKIQAEAEVTQWCQSRGVIFTILRLPLIYSKNPPGNLRAMIKGIKNGYYFNIAGGQARKSMVRAEDIARFILPASEVGGIYHLTDGVHPSFHSLSHFIGKSYGRRRIPNISLWCAILIAKFGDVFSPKFPLNSDKLNKITSELTFDDSSARNNFGWDPNAVVI
jgi:nucleoside-diphosphate-sugar epimerase